MQEYELSLSLLLSSLLARLVEEEVEKEDNLTIPNSPTVPHPPSHPKQFIPPPTQSNKQSTESTLSLTPHSNLNTSITSNHYTR